MRLLFQHRGSEQIFEADATQQFLTDAISNSIYDLSAILGRVDMHTKRTFAKRLVNHFHNGVSDGGYVRIRRYKGGEPFADFLAQARIGTDSYSASLSLSSGEPALAK